MKKAILNLVKKNKAVVNAKKLNTDDLKKVVGGKNVVWAI